MVTKFQTEKRERGVVLQAKPNPCSKQRNRTSQHIQKTKSISSFISFVRYFYLIFKQKYGKARKPVGFMQSCPRYCLEACGQCVDDVCHPEACGQCVDDVCHPEACGWCVDDVCHPEACGQCVDDVCHPEACGQCVDDVCHPEACGQCVDDVCHPEACGWSVDNMWTCGKHVDDVCHPEACRWHRGQHSDDIPVISYEISHFLCHPHIRNRQFISFLLSQSPAKRQQILFMNSVWLQCQ